MLLGALWGDGEAASPTTQYGFRKIATWQLRLRHVPFPSSRPHSFAILLFTPRPLKIKIPSTDSALPSVKQELHSLAEQQPHTPAPQNPSPHHTQGVLNENKRGSAAKASLTNTHLRPEIPLVRLMVDTGRGWARMRWGQGFPWILTCWCSDLAEATSVLRRCASGPRGAECPHLHPFSSRNVLSKRRKAKDFAT